MTLNARWRLHEGSKIFNFVDDFAAYYSMKVVPFDTGGLKTRGQRYLARGDYSGSNPYVNSSLIITQVSATSIGKRLDWGVGECFKAEDDSRMTATLLVKAVDLYCLRRWDDSKV